MMSDASRVLGGRMYVELVGCFSRRMLGCRLCCFGIDSMSAEDLFLGGKAHLCRKGGGGGFIEILSMWDIP